jgi:hypothetical protein
MSTCNQLDLEALGFWPIVPENLPRTLGPGGGRRWLLLLSYGEEYGCGGKAGCNKIQFKPQSAGDHRYKATDTHLTYMRLWKGSSINHWIENGRDSKSITYFWTRLGWQESATKLSYLGDERERAGDSWHSLKIIRADEKNTGII